MTGFYRPLVYAIVWRYALNTGAIPMSTFYMVYEDTFHLLDMEYDIQFILMRVNGKRLDLLEDTGEDFDNRLTLIDDNLSEETLITPEAVYAEGNLEALEYTDLLILPGSQLLVMSKRLLELLLTIKPFAYRVPPGHCR
jgi:hypothetical protein